MAATDTQRAGEILCTLPEVKGKDLTVVFARGPQTYLLKPKALPGWGFGRADGDRLISRWALGDKSRAVLSHGIAGLAGHRPGWSKQQHLQIAIANILPFPELDG